MLNTLLNSYQVKYDYFDYVKKEITTNLKICADDNENGFIVTGSITDQA